MMIALILICSILALICWNKRRQTIPKLHGIYSQQQDLCYPLRIVIFYVILSANSLIQKIVRLKKGSAVELKQHHNINVLPQQHHVTTLGFHGSDKFGNVVAIKIRRHFNHIAEALLTIKLADDGRLLVLPIQPDCLLVMDETPFDEDAERGYVAAAGIRIRTQDPVKYYRIMYCGLLQIDGQQQPQFVKANIRLSFASLTDPVYDRIDYDPFLVAKAIAVEARPYENLLEFLTSKSVSVEQSGEMRGRITLDDDKTHEVALNGIREFSYGPTPTGQPQGFFNLKTRFDNGMVLSLRLSSFKDGLTHLVEGFLSLPNGYVYPVSWTDLHLSQLPRHGNVFKNTKINISAHSKMLELDIEPLSSRSCLLVDARDLGAPLVVNEQIVKVTLNAGESSGFGTLEFNCNGHRAASTFSQQKTKVLIRELHMPIVPTTPPQCVQLADPLCRISSLTGGKAAKLADIVAVVSKLDAESVDLKVPDGFAITVQAYENHIREHPQIGELVAKVLELAQRISKEPEKNARLTAHLEEACEKVHEAFVESPLTSSLEAEIAEHLKRTFGQQHWNETFTAVRSSAVGEDGTEASGAGQMETFLGRKGLAKIGEAIKLCWASHFAFRAIQYRRQLCAKLDSPMAVLVQGLVKAEVAGVLFTRDPDSGSCAKSIINACYGIGEGVVSGHVQPDTVSVYQIDPSDGDRIRIAYDIIGEKATAYRLDEERGVVEEESLAAVELDHNEKCCLDELEIRRLYSVGKLIERIFGSARDIEFALKKDAQSGQPSIFILQARPITTADMEQEWELMQEFDSPMASDREWVTTANVQEMMPGALSPLSGQVWLEGLQDGMELDQVRSRIKPKRRFSHVRLLSMHRQHVFINWTMVNAATSSEYDKMAGDMAIFGRKVDDFTYDSFLEQNDMRSLAWRKYFSALEWFNRLRPSRGMNDITELIDNFQVPSSTNPRELFQYIKESMKLVRRAWYEHIRVSVSATMYPMVCLHTMDKTMNWGPQIYDDMATLLSTCTDVFSADVPTQLQNIAASLKNGDRTDFDHFMAMDRSECAQWLLSNASKQHGTLFRQFMAKHGHRCVRDSDIRETSWREEPEKVIDAIKVMMQSEGTAPQAHDKKREMTVDEAIDALKTPIDRIQRLVLKIFVPKARHAVGQREWAKSYGIKMMDNYRKLYRRLSQLLTEQGIIPDTDLIFFLVPEEIDSLLDRRSPKLIAKALRRRKLFSKFNGLQFPEIINGHPNPLESNPSALRGDDSQRFVLKGMAVGSGCIEGVARVVKSLSDANQIQPGDILIVPYTDVGWTPYFPMISGLVTELGGLISHGAVVAREYGLPCLVGCKRATVLVQTGDMVYINGHTGEIEVQPASK